MLAQARDAVPADGQPDAPARGFHDAREVHVVDDLAADGADSADTFQRLSANEDAPARGRGPGVGRVAHPAHRIEDVEEEEKRRNHEPLGERAAVEAGHPAREREAVRLRVRDQRAQ